MELRSIFFCDHRVTCGWECYPGHEANDLVPYCSDWRVRAPFSGTVIEAMNNQPITGWTHIGGNYVKIQAPNGIVVYMGHFEQWSVRVNVGDWVNAGDVVARMGTTGYTIPETTGHHVHFDIRTSANGAKLRPEPYIIQYSEEDDPQDPPDDPDDPDDPPDDPDPPIPKKKRGMKVWQMIDRARIIGG